MSRRRQIVSATGVISAFTLLSRLLGVVRDAVIGAHLGRSVYNDIFVIAFTIPNLARRVLGEGALSAFIVPVVTGVRKRDGDERAWRFAANAFNLFLAITLVLTLAGILLAKPLFYAYGGYGLAQENAKERVVSTPTAASSEGIVPPIVPVHVPDVESLSGEEISRLGARLTAIMFPYLMLLALFALAMGLLHSLKHFATPASGSAVANVIVIGAALLFYRTGKYSFVHVLAWAVLVSGLVRLLILLPPLLRRGFRFTREFNWRDRDFRELLSKMPYAVGAALVAQVNYWIMNNLAGLTGAGAITAIGYSQRLIQLPIALFSTALSTALLPQLSSVVAEDNRRELRDMMTFAFRAVSLVTFPAAIGLMALSRPIVQFIFEHGHWSTADTQATASVLFYFAAGLVAFDIQRILVPVYYAQKDMWTPVKFSLMAMVVNTILMITLSRTALSFAGLALASSIAAIVYTTLLWRGLTARFGRDLAGPAGRTLLRAFSCAAVMGLIVHFGYLFSERATGAHGTIPVLILTLLWVGMGMGVYAALSRLAGLWDRPALMRLLRR